MKFAGCKQWIADLARPFAVYSSSASAAWATVTIAHSGKNFTEAAFFIGAVWTGVGAIYIGKAFENTRIAGHSAEVEKARAQASAPAADDTAGELPLDRRVRLP